MKIGNVNIENNLVLAPMAGVTDLPFRILLSRIHISQPRDTRLSGIPAGGG